MIIVLKPKATKSQIETVIREVRKLGYKPHPIIGVERTVIAAIGDERSGHTLETLTAMSCVDQVMPVQRRYKLVTHFPPTPGDPYLRYIFPREVKPDDKSLLFDIYIPGLDYPQRHLEFWHWKGTSDDEDVVRRGVRGTLHCGLQTKRKSRSR